MYNRHSDFFYLISGNWCIADFSGRIRQFTTRKSAKNFAKSRLPQIHVHIVDTIPRFKKRMRVPN